MAARRGVCVHCRKARWLAGRGLCSACHRRPAVRRRYRPRPGKWNNYGRIRA